ncbi:restriction endonuclease subunit S [Azonexus sp.]|uniref:restriction endonuclease subunit S n=1 Tax=Azonexus sp. TaxID=1872668 RepID=UPI0035B4D10B
MSFDWLPFTELLSAIVDNRGRTCPVGDTGIPLIATNCIDAGSLYPRYDTTRYVSDETYNTWFRGHPKPGDILFVCKGSPGRTNWVPDPVDFCIAQDMVSVRANPEKIYPKYLFAALRSSEVQSQIDNMHVGTMIPHFKKGDFGKLNIPVPSRNVQQIIGDFYFSLSERITLLRETNATLEAIAQALFKSWFVDFDPVRAKQEGRAPEGMDEATAALFPDAFEESELGLVPKGWRWVVLEEAYWINPPRKLKKGASAPYIDMSSVPTQGHSPEIPTLREHGSGSKFQNGDTLLARITPCLENGKSAFVDCLDDGQIAWGSTEFIVLKPKPPLPDYHAYLLCRHPAFREYAIQSMSGTSGRQRVQNDVLGRFMIALPDTSIAEAFGAQVLAIQQKIAENHQQAQTLATLRDTLLPRLISGQLRLPEAESLIAECA